MGSSHTLTEALLEAVVEDHTRPQVLSAYLVTPMVLAQAGLLAAAALGVAAALGRRALGDGGPAYWRRYWPYR